MGDGVEKRYQIGETVAAVMLCPALLFVFAPRPISMAIISSGREKPPFLSIVPQPFVRMVFNSTVPGFSRQAQVTVTVMIL